MGNEEEGEGGVDGVRGLSEARVPGLGVAGVALRAAGGLSALIEEPGLVDDSVSLNLELEELLRAAHRHVD